MDETYEKRGYLLEDFRLFHLRDTERPHFDFHYHEFYKLVLLLAGSGGYVVDGRRYEITAGDAVLVGLRRVHRAEFAPGTLCERVIIYLSPEFLRRSATADCPLEDCFSGQRGHVLRPDEAGRRMLFSLTSALERELGAQEYGRELVCNCLLLRLLVTVGRGLSRSGSSLPSPVLPAEGKTLDILRYIDGHLTEDMDADLLAERFFISKYHMMRCFRRETGSSLHGYISEKRLLLARDLLLRGMPATEACFQSGYRSYSSFARAYTKLFGATPTGRGGDAASPEFE